MTWGGSARGQRVGRMGPRIREDNGGERRWIPAPVFMGRLCAGATKGGGDGSPHPRGQRRGGRMGSRPASGGQALRGGNGVGRRWVPASARGEEMGPRIREDNGGEGGWVPASAGTSEVGQALRGGNGVGRRWVPASARTTEGRDDGFPPRWIFMGQALRGGNGVGRRWVPASAGQRRGETMGSRPCLHGQALRGGNEVGRRWVPASARTTEVEDGFPPPREALVQEGYGTGLNY